MKWKYLPLNKTILYFSNTLLGFKREHCSVRWHTWVKGSCSFLKRPVRLITRQMGRTYLCLSSVCWEKDEWIWRKRRSFELMELQQSVVDRWDLFSSTIQTHLTALHDSANQCESQLFRCPKSSERQMNSPEKLFKSVQCQLLVKINRNGDIIMLLCCKDPYCNSYEQCS